MRSCSRIVLLVLLFAVVACSPGDSDPVESVQPQQSPSSIELARSGYAAFERGDMQAVRDLLDDDLVWYEAESLPYGGVYHGPDAVFENIFGAIGRDWSDYEAEPLRFIDGGDHAVVIGEYRGIHNESGGRLQAPFAHVWRFEDGRLVEFHQFTDTVLWLEAERGDR